MSQFPRGKFGPGGRYGPYLSTTCPEDPTPWQKPLLQNWYPEFRPHLEYVLHYNCSAEYEYYQTHYGSSTYRNCAIAAVVSCLLDRYDPLGLANMQSAAVLLGLLPTTLALAGSTTAEVSFLALRRPLLALLVGAGYPAVNPIRAFNYRDPKDILQFRPQSHVITRQKKLWHQIACSVFQYTLAITAVVNLGLTSWQLGLRTISSWAAQSGYIYVVWAFLSVAIHVAGFAATMLRVQLAESSEHSQEDNCNKRNIRQKLWSWAMRELQPSSVHAPATLILRQESTIFLVLSWITSTGTVLHIIYGTFAFSGTLFISSRDAVGVGARYLASTLVCSMILAYEMSGMRQVVEVQQDENHIALAMSIGLPTPHSTCNCRQTEYPTTKSARDDSIKACNEQHEYG